MTYACPPDLPFSQLLIWHAKNFAVVLILIAVILGGYLLVNLAKAWKRNRRNLILIRSRK